ncbi:MAG TPA: hypothetical protein PLH75_08240 [Amaricoccus sp.]|uniref:hypothetical protein n=1 Tax=Amaricoccus sp. TaxID=1872485 RepID=UPI002C3B2121|nr:hypothetical protein [Amaricoccus sp.]HPG22764.1 hypothetical protein [Amaricoccus sp.]HRW16201.1 hypothetical protein [Amaricoccus sp.]
MGHFRILAALALALAAGQASAQDVVEPPAEDIVTGGEEVAGDPDAPVEVVEAIAEDEALAGDDDGVLPGDDAAADDPGAPVEEGEAVAEDEAQVGDDVAADGTDDPVEEPFDSRSARGMERAADGAQVSRMARAGLGPVFGALRSQGYGAVEMSEAEGLITIDAARGGESRTLVYDAATGALLSDSVQPSSGGFAERFFGPKAKTAKRGGAERFERKTTKVRSRGAKDGSGRGHGGDKASRGGGSGKSAGGGRGSSGGGNGKGGGKGGGNGKGGGKGGKNR